MKHLTNSKAQGKGPGSATLSNTLFMWQCRLLTKMTLLECSNLPTGTLVTSATLSHELYTLSARGCRIRNMRVLSIGIIITKLGVYLGGESHGGVTSKVL